jgi:asparagine synthase (glutamine-hydrolysing)
MPGIYGVINHSLKHISDREIAESLKHFPFYSDVTFKCGSFEGGVITRNTPVLLKNKDKGLFVLYGDIYSIGRAEFRGDIEELFAKYRKFGNELFKEINGEFCAVIWDEKKKSLQIITDHLGTKPIYFYRDRNHTIIAPEVKAIMRVIDKCVINLNAVREFLTFGFCLYDHTFIKNIDLALPGCVTEISTSISKNEYWPLQDFINGENSKEPIDELVKTHQQLLDAAINKRVPQDKTLCVSLSGGLDSRTIVAFLDRHKQKNVKTTTFGVKNCLDEKYAKEVARFLNLPNIFHELAPAKMKESFDEVAYLMDGMLCVKHIHDYPFLPEKYRDWDTHITGFLGDPIHGQRLFPSNPLEPDVSKAKSEKEFLRLIIRKHSQYGLKGCGILNENDGEEKLLTSVKTIVEKSQLSHPLQISDYFDIHERQRRFIAQIFQLAGKVFDYKMPFADRSLVEFCLSLPVSYRKKQRLARASFIEAFPELASIPWQKTHTHLKTNQVKEKASASIYYFQYAFKRLIEFISLGTRSYRPPHIYDPYDEWSRKEFKLSLENILLDEKTLSRGLYNSEKIKNIFSRHMVGIRNEAEIIYLLLTLELWFRRSLDTR